jgi:hypothetical protein
MAYILNIGLARDGKENLTALDALVSLSCADIKVVEAKVYDSDSEPTLVARVSKETFLRTAVNWVAIGLEQDCIGLYDAITGKGQLIGPRADKWGEFNPEYFLLLDGSRLSQPELKLAA